MDKLFGYIVHRAPFLIMYAIAMLMCLLIPYFAGGDMDLAAYTAELITFFIVCVLIVDIKRYHKKMRMLDEIKGTLTALSRRLPKTADPIEKSYTELIDEICGEYDDISSRLISRRQDSLEYYTLWIHQIKTPIAALRLLLEQGDVNTAIARQELFKIEQYAQMALRYIKLWDISNDIVLSPCNIEDGVKSALRTLAVPFVYKKLSVEVGVSGCVLTDKKWLEFIIEQLLSNAVKYTHTGGIRLYGDEKALCIEDTGIGIKAEDIPRIFEKGYTGYNGRIDERASGIGLYMVKRAADALSIRIEVESRLNRGTRFTLYFPKNEREIYK